MRRALVGLALCGALAVLAWALRLGTVWSVTHAVGPALDGHLRVSGIHDGVRVVRDRYGHAHIAAQDEGDAFFGLGFAHAQDRFGQMELLRRAARGRLAEVFGASAVAQDRLARTLGLEREAGREAEHIPQDSRALLESYASGVNGWLGEVRAGRAELPAELRWLGAPLEDWSVVDCLAVLRLRSWSLSRSLGASLLLDRLVREQGSSASEPLFPGTRPGAQASALSSLFALGAAADGLARSVGLDGPAGSSGFIVGAGLSRTGRPLLANDPHVELGLPPRFYIAHLETPERSIAGATWPGLPIFWLGTNRRIAWGQVILRAIVSDLFDETLDPRNPYRYNRSGEWLDAERESSSIEIRSHAPEPIEIVRTRHGPLVASIRPDDPAVRSYAIRWTGAERRSGIDALLALQRAANWNDFRGALRAYPAPPATFLYADVDGAIGTQVAGQLPVRAIDTQLLPVPAEYDWTGFVPFDSLPQRFGRDVPWIAVSRDGDGSALAQSSEWLWPEGGGASRVRERLAAAKPLDLERVLAIQRETVSAEGQRRVRELLGNVKPRTRGARSVLDVLTAWDGSTSPESAGAAAYHVFRQELTRRLLAARFSDSDALREQIEAAEPLPGVLLERFVDRATGGERSSDLVAEALDDTWNWLAARVSSNPRRWFWGGLGGVRFAHPFEQLGSGTTRWVGSLLGLGPIPVPGDPDSAWTMYHGSLAAADRAVGPGLRFAIDLADVYHSRVELAGGQSGHPGSPYYTDALDDWLHGRRRLLWTHPTDVDDHAIGAWELEPLAPPEQPASAAPPPPPRKRSSSPPPKPPAVRP